MYIIFIASSLSISQSILFGDILCPMLTTILHWGIPPSLSSSILFCRLSRCSFYFLIFMGHHTGAYLPSLSLSGLLCTFSVLDLFLDLCESSYRGIPPLAFFLLGHTPLSLGLPCLVLISWLSDPFVDPYELSLRASPFCHLV